MKASDEPRLLFNASGLPSPPGGQIEATMARGAVGKVCAAHNCLKPHWKEGWCAGHWYAAKARLLLQAEVEDRPESLAICEAIWNAS